jgi:hypothetical protein
MTVACVHRYHLDHAVQAISKLSPGEIPSRGVLVELSTGWANQGFSANVDYMEEVSRQATSTKGNIVECGTGLTTILLGLLAGRHGGRVWSLEHSPHWSARVEAVLARHRIPGIRVLQCPLRPYDGFWWYDVTGSTLPKEISLVVCDGPPGDTPGGRFGLLSVLGDRLGTATILFDDADRPGEKETLGRWEAESELRFKVHHGPNGAFAVGQRLSPPL